MRIVDLENVLRHIIKRIGEDRNNPQVSPLDRSILNEKFNWAIGMLSYVSKIRQTEEEKEMIEGIVVGRGRASELPNRQTKKPSPLEVTILELAAGMEPDSRIDIDPYRVKYDSFAVKLGNLKKVGRVGKDFGLRKTDKGYSFIRKPVGEGNGHTHGKKAA